MNQIVFYLEQHTKPQKEIGFPFQFQFVHSIANQIQGYTFDRCVEISQGLAENWLRQTSIIFLNPALKSVFRSCKNVVIARLNSNGADILRVLRLQH
jgi:hypothetical protein